MMPKLHTQRHKRSALEEESPSPPILVENEDISSPKRARIEDADPTYTEEVPLSSLSEYELERKKRIEQNEAFKRTLGLTSVSFQVASKPQVISKKRVVASEPSRKSLRLKRAQDPTIELYTELEEPPANKEAVARRGARLYDPVNGVTCHQCRQKTLDPKSICANEMTVGSIYRHKYCGSCLRNRYNENIEEVNQNKNWLCPFCRGDCNCSICKKKQKCKPHTKTPRKARRHAREEEEDEDEEEQPPSPVSSASPASSPVHSPSSYAESQASHDAEETSEPEDPHATTCGYPTEMPLAMPLPDLSLHSSSERLPDPDHSLSPNLSPTADCFSTSEPFSNYRLSDETEVIFASLPPLFTLT